jgi:L-iditol 2-dehydrogenase
MIKPLSKGEILVKVGAALTCGTDVKTYRRGHPVLIKKIPSGFGHEFAGTVAKVADGVENVKVGDRVVCANSAPCGHCFYCKRGEYNLCENLDLLNGAYAEYIVVPERIVQKNTIILPDTLPFHKAAFAEPLANVVHGVERTDIKAGDTVGIIGIGPIGLMFARLTLVLRGLTDLCCALKERERWIYEQAFQLVAHLLPLNSRLLTLKTM